MSKRQRHPLIRIDARKQIARLTKKGLFLLIAFLIAVILGLIFEVGKLWWPLWPVGYHTEIAGIILFITLLVTGQFHE
jgi:hypothetical protein